MKNSLLKFLTSMLYGICILYRQKAYFQSSHDSNRGSTVPLHSIKDPPNGPGKPVLQSESSKPSL
jgi:hypothetical protein